MDLALLLGSQLISTDIDQSKKENKIGLLLNYHRTGRCCSSRHHDHALCRAVTKMIMATMMLPRQMVRVANCSTVHVLTIIAAMYNVQLMMMTMTRKKRMMMQRLACPTVFCMAYARLVTDGSSDD